jgi:hypothetical protein
MYLCHPSPFQEKHSGNRFSLKYTGILADKIIALTDSIAVAAAPTNKTIY